MARLFTVTEVRALLPEVRARAEAYVDVRADFAEAQEALRSGEPAAVGGLAEVKSLEARVHEALEWFRAQEIQVKGIAPLLLDFPAVAGGRDILLCWLEGESTLDWYHPVELGFLGRRRLERLPTA